jgi:four helix bundle protein
MPLKSCRELIVWQKGMDLVVRSHQLTALLPRNEIYGIASQIQRAAVSIPANIAEGHGRTHLGEYLHSLSVANGSLMELETHLLIVERLSFIPPKDLKPVLLLCADVGKLLAGLIRGLEKKCRGNSLI